MAPSAATWPHNGHKLVLRIVNFDDEKIPKADDMIDLETHSSWTSDASWSFCHITCEGLAGFTDCKSSPSLVSNVSLIRKSLARDLKWAP